MKKLNHNRMDFSVIAIIMIPIAVAINVIGGQITNLLKLPFYLDTIGTILMSALGGPVIGSLTVILSTLFNSLLRPQAFPFVLTGIGIALLCSFATRLGAFKALWRAGVLGVLTAILSVLISAPIVVFLFGGISGTGTSVVTGLLMATGKQMLTSVITTGLIFGIFDKTLSVIVVYLLLRSLPLRSVVQFPNGRFLLGGVQN